MAKRRHSETLDEDHSSVPASGSGKESSLGPDESTVDGGEDWHDNECLKLVENSEDGTTLCCACQALFDGSKQFGDYYKHLLYLRTLRRNARGGCRLCALLEATFDANAAIKAPEEELELTICFEVNENSILFFAEFINQQLAARPGPVFNVVPVQDPGTAYEHQITDSTGSSSTKNLIIHWLQQCRLHHSDCICPSGTDISWMPTRLLDICSSDVSDDVRVIQSSTIPSQADYIALSHCWGSESFLTLTANNENELKRGIQLTRLPQTFQDAVTVAKWLEVRYLWIDSLCIIQDSDSGTDWQREADTMKAVYRNAVCTVAATGASNPSVGCFARRDQVEVQAVEIDAAWHDYPERKYRCLSYGQLIKSINNAPLSKRAWAVQERLLSTRVIHFTSKQVFWECAELFACETLPGGIAERLYYGGPVLAPSINKVNLLTSANLTRKLLNAWKLVVEMYMRGRLTYPSDKAIALSGLANEFRSRFKDDYLAGLWRQSLNEQLLWFVNQNSIQVDGKSKRPSPYRAPTWSWLSVDAEVHLWPNLTEEMVGRAVPTTLIEILDVQIQLLGNNKTGQITGGYIKIHGYLKAATTVSTGPSTRWALQIDGKKMIDLIGWWDEGPPGVCAENLFLLPVLYYGGGQGLILTPTGIDEDQYRRLGYFFTRKRADLQRLLRKKRVYALDHKSPDAVDAAVDDEDRWHYTDLDLNDNDLSYEPLTKEMFTIV